MRYSINSKGWYGAKILFKAIDKEGKTRLVEESVRLIKADSLDDADKKAKEKALLFAQDHLFDPTLTVGPEENHCRWEFDEVLDVYQMDENIDFPSYSDGVEVYSRIFNDEQEILNLKSSYE